MRKLALGVAMSAALAMTLTACQGGADSPRAGVSASPTASPTPSAAEILAAAVTRTQATSFRFTLGDARDHGDGRYDPTGRAVSFVQADEEGRFELVAFGPDIYLVGFGGFTGKTVHVNAAKLGPTSVFAVLADPLAALRFLAVAGTVEAVGTGNLKGTLDLTKVPASEVGASRVAAFLATSAGAKAGSVPFTATVDSQGRLTSFRSTFPSADDGKDLEYELRLSDFGTPVSIVKPTRNVVEAPATLYNG